MIPFRTKLSLIISVVALLVLAIAFVAVDREIEKEFRLVIEQRLLQAQRVVNQRMEDRFTRLLGQAISASESKLIQDLLTDRTLSRATVDDIVRDEILPNLQMADTLLVVDGEGLLLADTSPSAGFWRAIQAQPAFADGMAGEGAAGLAMLETHWSQWLLLPVFIGDQMFGAVILASQIGEEELRVISELTGTELLIATTGGVLATNWNGHRTGATGRAVPVDVATDFGGLVSNTRNAAYPVGKTREVSLNGERFLLRYQVSENNFIPPFLVAQSLDNALAFTDAIKRVMLVIAVLALFAALVLGFIFASTVARPIHALRDMTRAVAREDFAHRIDIRTRDEFRELGEAFNQMSESLAEKAAVRAALDKSVSRDVADHLLSEGVELGGETREATILFADIRGFTTLSEQLSETRLLELLNEYFTRINACIQQYQGTIDKFIGDAVMAIFGAPFDDPRHAGHAVQAALAMRHAVDRFNEEVSDRCGCEVHIGIGINTGRVVSGLVGSEDRLNYTVLGDQVNIAARMENLCRFYGADLVVTGATRDAILARSDELADITFRRLDSVQVKGKTVAIDIYQPLPAREGIGQRLQGYHEALQALFEQRFDAAAQAFERYTALWPSDRVAQQWLLRCREYQRQPRAFSAAYRDKVRILDAK